MVTLSHQAARPLRPFMEHRWGVRLEIDLPARFECAGRVTSATIHNISVSGALIGCDIAVPMLAALEVVIPPAANRPHELRLAGRVVRREPGAIAVEWEDMACRPLLGLLHQFGNGVSGLS